MKYNTLFIVVWVISYGALTNARGGTELQRATVEDNTAQAYSQRDFFAPLNNEVVMHLCYDFFVPGKTHKIKFVVALPKTIPDRQKIREIECFPRPSREFSSKCGNQYAEFIFTEPKRRFDVEIHVKAELFRYDLSTARKKYKEKLFLRYDGEDYLQDESGIECDDFLIKKIARTIKGQSETETLKNIHNYVINNLEYRIHKERKGAAYAAQQKTGDCSEYSDLFVAICRAKRIPARVVTGYAVVVSDTLPKHAWAEVYLRKYGWVPFDPTWADAEEPWLRKELFQTMKPVYIHLKYPSYDEVFCHGRDNAIWRRGDKVEMEESVKFKKWKWKRPALKENIVTTKPKVTHGVVGGILYDKDNPSAIIDGNILKEGDTIHGVKVIKIYEDKVEFEKNNRKWTQKAGETADTFWQ